jgi:hypothetical protein
MDYPEGPAEWQYRAMARAFINDYGPLQRVEYLSHYPEFRIKFVFNKKTIYSERRTGALDINYLSLGYVGNGPTYARAFLDEAGFSMTFEEIKYIEPGDVLTLQNGKVVKRRKEDNNT